MEFCSFVLGLALLILRNSIPPTAQVGGTRIFSGVHMYKHKKIVKRGHFVVEHVTHVCV